MADRTQSDFPIDWAEDAYVSRREFFKFVTVAGGGLAVGSTALAAFASLSRESRSFDPVLVARLDELQPGQAKGFGYPRKQDLCLLVRRTDGELAAFSRRCTHLSCPVNYEPDKERLYCPCHNGAFSSRDGSVLQGPPPHALPRVELDVRGEEIWAVGIVKAEEEAS